MVTWSTGWRSGAATYGMMLMTTKASLFLPGREMRTKKWPTTMTVAVAMVDGDDDDGDSVFYGDICCMRTNMLSSLSVERQTDGRTDVFMHVVVDI